MGEGPLAAHSACTKPVLHLFAFTKLISQHVVFDELESQHIALTEFIYQLVAFTKLVFQHVAFMELISQHVSFAQLICHHIAHPGSALAFTAHVEGPDRGKVSHTFSFHVWRHNCKSDQVLLLSLEPLPDVAA